ncbi:hypothetical protein cypCar_00023783, partial [Cyprinus carpio]
QVAEVNGGGFTPGFGSYYGPTQTNVGLSNGVIQTRGSATLPRMSGSREERLIKFSGIGPVDETGMPIASRSATLVSELNRFEAELDSDIRGLERKLSQKQQRRGRGEGSKANTATTRTEENRQENSYPIIPCSAVKQGTTASFMHSDDRITSSDMDFPPKREERKMKAARVKFNFQAQSPKELTLQKGDVVYIHRQVDANWYEGEHHGRVGIFPTSYVEIIPPTEKPTPIKSPTIQVLEYGEAVALFNFNADLPVELSFRKDGTRTQSPQPNADVKIPSTSQSPVNMGYSRQPYRAVYNYKPQNKDELELREGDLVQVIEKCDDGWFVGTSERTQAFGTFPGNYVAPV